MKDFLVFGGFLVFWIVLNRWLLPYFSIQTCMRDACSRPSHSQKQRFNPTDKRDLDEVTIHQSPQSSAC